jgi:predicted transcriptional regulator
MMSHDGHAPGRVLAALSDPTRRRLFEAIAANPGISTSELTARAALVTRWAVMKHLEVLRAAGLVQTMATGRQRRHYAERAALGSLKIWVDSLAG